jgi:integrase
MPLTDLVCRKTKPCDSLKKYSDMHGLQLWIFPNGSKLWRYAYRFDGKQKLIAVGRYPQVSLHDARAEREKARESLRQGRDPSHVRAVARLENSFAEDKFALVAAEYLEKLRREGRSRSTLKKVEWLLGFATGPLGSYGMREIRPVEVLAVLRGVEGRGRYETARRLRSTIGAVFRYAIATARADTDPTEHLIGALTTRTSKPRAAITATRPFGALLRAIDGFDGQPETRIALQLMALLFPRPGELRMAEWKEFDWEEKVWEIPAQRMKMRRPHRVPLAPQAIARLTELHALSGSGALLFSSTRSPDRPISDNTLNAALRRLGYSTDDATAHGFRASASTLLNESRLWNPDVIERQLAHQEANDVRRVYDRSDHWDERVKLMTWWANYLDTLRAMTSGPPPFGRTEGRLNEDRP